MKNHKFRAWVCKEHYLDDPRSYYMAYDVAVLPAHLFDEMHRNGKRFSYNPISPSEGIYSCAGDYEHLMMCTGLADKEGKEIYEGDILRRNDFTFKIVWDEELAMFYFSPVYSPDDYIKYMPFFYSSKEWGVIGNIYENQELINERD